MIEARVTIARKIDGTLFIAGGRTVKLLETIDQALDVIALFVQGSAKWFGACLIKDIPYNS
jgi:hypothetical protein